ncbi:DUF397 domain-containing protein [Streptomyces sp. Je 1-369]|uniref:DUF397 domain-containing protein n=1 Tax=Streptomyces sp. Je 1-369 TaxID=2966192 RepID=UPI002286AA60|nr:DUF397 domain-containing protein [Streptomyces sp. Je 1-369]WAL97057.1 DUF397 domain-containing protein [Streptomyces sp. Je 1-369]
MHELVWQKSSFSDGAGVNCLYVAASHNAETVHLRESDAPTTTLTTHPAAFAALIRTLSTRTTTSRPLQGAPE